MTTTITPRMSKEARRDQLLDAAAQVLIERGTAGLTMEGVAAAAGVSKSLPYSHFDNAEAVLIALHQREIGRMGGQILAAMQDLPKGPARLDAAIRAYFDSIAERGTILSALASDPAVHASGDADVGPDFVGELLVENFGLARPVARIYGTLVLGALMAATDLWSRGGANRRTLERSVCDFVARAVSP